MLSICFTGCVMDRLFLLGSIMQIDYYAYHSGMKNWNPGMKMLLAVGTLFLVILLDRIPVSLFVAVSMGALTLLVGRIPWPIYVRYMTVPLFFMIFSGAVIAIQFTGQPMGGWSLELGACYLCVTKESLVTALRVFFKALAGMSALYMLTFSTPVNEVILILQKLRLPRLLVDLMNLIYRYIFILFDAATQMQTAGRARLGYQSFMRSCRSFSQIAGNLFLISLKKANAYYDALLSRGYAGRLEFLTEAIPVKGWQVLGCVLYFVAVVFLAAACG